MKRKMLLIFNHRLTAEQESDARNLLGISDFVPLSEPLRNIWCSISPDADSISPTVEPVIEWMQQHASAGDCALVQGDYGACHLVVAAALAQGLTPVYATTSREVVETPETDGSLKITHRFRHRRFRVYGK